MLSPHTPPHSIHPALRSVQLKNSSIHKFRVAVLKVVPSHFQIPQSLTQDINRRRNRLHAEYLFDILRFDFFVWRGCQSIP